MFHFLKTLLVLLVLTKYINCNFYDKSVSNFSKCTTYYSKSEVDYKKFFPIIDIPKDDKLIFDFHFSVRAPSDAHILITPSNVISKYDPIYEIVLGAGGNIYSDIRRLQKKGTKHSKTSISILSASEIRSFWIHISYDGLIEVGKEGEREGFLKWKDPDPLPIKYFSFGTYIGVNADWYYNCKRDNIAPIAQEFEPELSVTEKLKKHLFKNYDPYVQPILHVDDITIVHLNLMYNRIHLNELNAKLQLDGVAHLEWLDEKLNWSLSDYPVNSLKLDFRRVWQPNLYVYNAVAGAESDVLQYVSGSVNNDGLVACVAKLNTEVWCDAAELGHWPNDVHTCDIQFGFWTQENFLFLELITNSSNPKYNSEWKILKITEGYYPLQTPWHVYDDLLSSSYVTKFTLQRNSNVYTTIYYAPLFLISISLLVSFWLPANEPYRISLYCLQLIILSFVFSKLASAIPAHPTHVPNLSNLLKSH